MVVVESPVVERKVGQVRERKSPKVNATQVVCRTQPKK